MFEFFEDLHLFLFIWKADDRSGREEILDRLVHSPATTGVGLGKIKILELHQRLPLDWQRPQLMDHLPMPSLVH